MANFISIVVPFFKEKRMCGHLLSGTASVHGCASNQAGSSFGRSLTRDIAAAVGDITVFPNVHVDPVWSTWLEHLTKPFEGPPAALANGWIVDGGTPGRLVSE